MNEWPLVALGEVASLDVRTVDVQATMTYPIVGLLNRGRGLLYRKPLLGAETSYKTLNQIWPGQIVYSRLKAFEGAITVAPPTLARAFASQEFPTFTCGWRLAPEYFSVLSTSTDLWATLQNLSTGMGGRRERVKPSDFLTISVALPPLDEQRRIVGVMSAVDAQIEALEAEIGSAQSARGPMIENLLSHEGAEAIPTALGEVGIFVRGRRFTKEEYVPSGLSCIHYGQVHTHFGSIATAAITFLADASRTRMRLAHPGDVVVAGTSENIRDLGNATVWLGDGDVAVHDDCYIFRHTLDPRFASYLFASPEFQREKIQFASGTKVTRISGENLGKVKVTIPRASKQAEIGAALSAVDAQILSLRSELSGLRTVRTDLLTALLTQQISINPAVDQFVKAA